MSVQQISRRRPAKPIRTFHPLLVGFASVTGGLRQSGNTLPATVAPALDDVPIGYSANLGPGATWLTRGFASLRVT